MERGKYKLTKEFLDKVRDIDGFPLGEDKDIIALSDPPYYTACPNPFIEDFIKEHGKSYDAKNDDYHREPFSFDISEGKNDPIYNVHPYHTKVPHKAIMKYILHYTNHSDVIFDGFAGTGMTGVAAQLCGESNHYKLLELYDSDKNLGARYAILNEISPSATYISNVLTKTYDKITLKKEGLAVLKEVEKELGYIYKTRHNSKIKDKYNNDLEGIINYVVWSDIFYCPHCMAEFTFWDVAVEENPRRIERQFTCPNCSSDIKKNELEKVYETKKDQYLNITYKKSKIVPVLINYKLGKDYSVRGSLYEKKPDIYDYDLINKIEETDIKYWYPIDRMPLGKESRRNDILGITHIHHYYTKRNLMALSMLYDKISRSKYKEPLLFVFQSICATLSSKLSRYNLGKRGNGPLSGTLYIGSLTAESNVLISFYRKLNDLLNTLRKTTTPCMISCSSSTNLSLIPTNCIDYIFTDPPFGGNLMYSELNYIWESWLKVLTNNKNEAIINDIQKKGLVEYQTLMEKCFKEYYRILKPNRWMTVEFHNSQNSVWIAIQEALLRAGFMVADVRTLDKQQNTFKQITTTSAVKQDLIISAYKPNQGLEEIVRLKTQSDTSAWDFTRQHLKHLPIYVENDGVVEIINERDKYQLNNRMLAFFVQRGIAVPISASEFYAGLKERFPERDGMYFLHDQVAEYDAKRMKAKRIEQSYLTVHDEKSAIQWLRRQLEENAQTHQDIQPEFLQNLYKSRHEDLPELREILEQNFVQDEQGKWHVPDPNKDRDLEQLRNRALLNEFQEILRAKGKLRVFRSEAIRVGFSHCWQNSDYDSIIRVAEKLPTEVLQEDPTLLMYYDNALARRS